MNEKSSAQPVIKTIEPQLKEAGSTVSLAKPVLNEEDPFSFITRIKLDVTVNAPLVIVPQLTSEHGLQLDCGVLTVRTTFDVLSKFYEQQSVKRDERKLNDRCLIPPVIEMQHISLANMEIARFSLNS